MLILTATTDSIDVVLNAAHTTNPHRCVVFYRDVTTTAFTPGRQVTNSNGVTQAAIVSAPAASTQRIVDTLTVFNDDTAAKTVTVAFNDNGTRFKLKSVLLKPGECLEYSEGNGWKVLDAKGGLKNYSEPSLVSGVPATGRKGAALLFKNGSQPVTAANFWHSYWIATAIPGAGTLATGNTTTGIIPTGATAGAMPLTQPTGGETAIIQGADITSTVSGMPLLYDRVFAIGAFTPTSGAIAGVTGTAITRPSSGENCRIAAEIVTALSAAAHTVTITYVNQDGTGGRTATVVLPASAPIGRVFWATLQAGDTGVRQITGVSGSATPPTGTYNLLIVRPLIEVGCVANVPRYLSAAECRREGILQDSCVALMFYNPAGTTVTTVNAALSLSYEV